ncbi:MAG: hypothetical protein SV775_09500 [Thermodesulfobacteriota bacterium]|nr:hypothetical protein [Thermodesulfobacteriota bacterium]
MGPEIKHYMNPLHVYCRLRDIGVAKGTASVLCRIYERCLFRCFFMKETTIR